MDTESRSGFKKGSLAHKARSAPLSVRHPDLAVPLNPDASTRISDQNLEEGKTGL